MMNRRYFAGLVAFTLVCCLGCAAEPIDDAQPVAGTDGVGVPEASPALQLIHRSIAFHDPEDRWSTGRFDLVQEASRPNGQSRVDNISIARGGSEFRLESEREGQPFVLEVQNDDVSLTIDGAEPSVEQAAALRLDQAGSLRMRNYYVYLYGLPMKLLDPGTLIDPDPLRVDLDGRETLQVRVAYEEGVGSDVWYFNFDPSTAEMIGYRFYHDEATEDGEYIELEGLAEIDGLRLPAKRSWYKFEQDEYLGADMIRPADVSSN